MVYSFVNSEVASLCLGLAIISWWSSARIYGLVQRQAASWVALGWQQPLSLALAILGCLALQNSWGWPNWVSWLPASWRAWLSPGLSTWLRLGLMVVVLAREVQLVYSWLRRPALATSFIVQLLLQGRVAIFIVLIIIGLGWLRPELSGVAEAAVVISIRLALIWSTCWLVLHAAALAEQRWVKRFAPDFKDFHTRSIATKAKIYRKIVTSIVLIGAVAASCLLFDDARNFGANLLASAGIATGIIGLAANKIIANFFAGIQLAVTQPIRINDAVTIDGEFGVVEDISLNYVVVKIWDLRRLVVPIHYFLDKPFLNFSRTSTDIISQINFYCDYRVPLTPLRNEFKRLVMQSAHWDGKTINLQVTELQENQLKLRGIASAATPAAAWDLRCEILEQLIAFIAQNYPSSLPRLRLETTPPLSQVINPSNNQC